MYSKEVVCLEKKNIKDTVYLRQIWLSYLFPLKDRYNSTLYRIADYLGQWHSTGTILQMLQLW